MLVVTGAVRVSVTGAWTPCGTWTGGPGWDRRWPPGCTALEVPHGPGDPERRRHRAGRPAAGRGGGGAAAHRRLRRRAVAVAAYDGKPRNPVLIGRPHWAAVLEMAVGDTGARPFLRAHPELVTLVECGDIGGAFDIDTAGTWRASRRTAEAPPGGGERVRERSRQGDWLEGSRPQRWVTDSLAPAPIRSRRRERVRRAGHRLHGDRGPVALRLQRVAGEHLQPAVARVHPHAGAPRRRPPRGPRPGRQRRGSTW